MGKMKTASLVVLAFFLSAEAIAQQPPATFLTHEELKEFFSLARDIRNVSEDFRRSSIITYQKDGTAIVQVDTTGRTYVGTWRIDGDRLCTDYSQLGRGCYKLQKTGMNSYKTFSADTGKVSGTWEVKK